KDWHPDGIILRNSKELKKILRFNIPTILVAHSFEVYPNLPLVKTDGETISKMAAEHLFDKGLRNFGYCGFDDFFWSIERQKAFEKFIKESGNFVSVFYQPRSSYKRKWENEQILMAEWLRKLPKPVGIMACNDDRAQHVT